MTTWRGDGKYLALSESSPSSKTKLAIIKASSLTIMAEHQGDIPLNGLICFQPNGRHLYAASLEEDGESRICLIESNGLAHGSFGLRTRGKYLSTSERQISTSGHVASIQWSPDSQLLAVLLRSESASVLQVSWK